MEPLQGLKHFHLWGEAAWRLPGTSRTCESDSFLLPLPPVRPLTAQIAQPSFEADHQVGACPLSPRACSKNRVRKRAPEA